MHAKIGRTIIYCCESVDPMRWVEIQQEGENVQTIFFLVEDAKLIAEILLEIYRRATK